MLENVQYGPPDPMYDLKLSADGDLSPHKADLGVGIYRAESGQYSEFRCVHQVRCLWSRAHNFGLIATPAGKETSH
jgi:aspartate aminotransferase, cytoplasmic